MEKDEPGQLHDASDEEPEPPDEAAGPQDESGAGHHGNPPTLSTVFELPVVPDWPRIDWPTSFKYLTECCNAAGVTLHLEELGEDALRHHLSVLERASIDSLIPRDWPSVLASLNIGWSMPAQLMPLGGDALVTLEGLPRIEADMPGKVTQALETLAKLNATGGLSTNAHPLTIGAAMEALWPHGAGNLLRDASAVLRDFAGDAFKSLVQNNLGVQLQDILPSLSALSEMSARASILRDSSTLSQRELARILTRYEVPKMLIQRPGLWEHTTPAPYQYLRQDLSRYPDWDREEHVQREHVAPMTCPFLAPEVAGSSSPPTAAGGQADCAQCLRLFSAGLAAERSGLGPTFMPPCLLKTTFARFLMTSWQSTTESGRPADLKTATPDNVSSKAQFTEGRLEQLVLVVSGEVRGTSNVVYLGKLQIFLDDSDFILFLHMLLERVLGHDGIEKKTLEMVEYRGRNIDQRLHSIRKAFDTALAHYRIDRQQFIRRTDKGKASIGVLPRNVRVNKTDLLYHEQTAVRLLASLYP